MGLQEIEGGQTLKGSGESIHFGLCAMSPTKELFPRSPILCLPKVNPVICWSGSVFHSAMFSFSNLMMYLLWMDE